MTAPTIIEALRAHGVKVLAEGDKLVFEAAALPPAEALALVETLKGCRGEALAVLTAWPGPCFCCKEVAWYLHRDGVPLCGRCHPPAFPEMVRAWMPAAACRWGGPCH